MRRVLFLLMLVTATATGARGAAGFVDLDKPGAMDKLKHDNPAHYEAVRGILANVLKQPEAHVPQWVRVTYKAEDVLYPPILLASDPPKRPLSFRLDDVLYRTILTLPRVEAIAEPAISTGRERPR